MQHTTAFTVARAGPEMGLFKMLETERIFSKDNTNTNSAILKMCKKIQTEQYTKQTVL